jgi:hypothetical protein
MPQHRYQCIHRTDPGRYIGQLYPQLYQWYMYQSGYHYRISVRCIYIFKCSHVCRLDENSYSNAFGWFILRYGCERYYFHRTESGRSHIPGLCDHLYYTGQPMYGAHADHQGLEPICSSYRYIGQYSRGLQWFYGYTFIYRRNTGTGIYRCMADRNLWR